MTIFIIFKLPPPSLLQHLWVWMKFIIKIIRSKETFWFYPFFPPKAYSLEAYRALEDKLALLDQATALQDGNAITAVSSHVLFYICKNKTLKKHVMYGCQLSPKFCIDGWIVILEFLSLKSSRICLSTWLNVIAAVKGIGKPEKAYCLFDWNSCVLQLINMMGSWCLQTFAQYTSISLVIFCWSKW